MDNQALIDAFAVLQTQARTLKQTLCGQMEENQIAEVASLGEAIRVCLPILQAAGESERHAVSEFMGILEDWVGKYHTLMDPCQPIVDALKVFSLAHEDWNKVETYAETEAKTDNFELHALAVNARKIVCTLEGTHFEVDSKLRVAPLLGPPIGQWVGDGEELHLYSSALGLTSGVHYFEALLLTRRPVKLGWATRRWGSSRGKWRKVDLEKLISQLYEPIDGQHFIGFDDASLPSGTVLGCLLNCPQRTFAFFVNGHKMTLQAGGVPFSSNPYYVHLLAPLLYLNFGQVPFKYPLPELATSPTTADLTRNPIRFYTNLTLAPLIDNHVEAYFTDAKQRKVTLTLRQLLEKGINQPSMAERRNADVRASNF